MKVVLFALNGSWVHSNLALRCLRPPLEREGFEVILLEHSLRDRSAHVLEALWQENADIYGFSCYIWNLNEMLSLAESLHSILPNARIIFGGPEVSYATERFDKLPFLDAVICGEGEDALPMICRAIRAKTDFPRVIEGGRPNVMRDEGILYRLNEATGGILYYESSRGCPYSCAYCLSSATHGVRFKSVEQTLTDLQKFEETDCRIIKFVDRTFNADIRRANAIWKALLAPCYTKNYHFEVCATLLDEESFEILAAFPKGKIQLEFGLQSTNPETLAAVSRHIKPQAVIQAVRRIHGMGNIHVHLDLIAGLPYESYERFARSFDDAYGCSDLLQLGFLKLLHGTELRARAEEYGYQCLPDPPYTVLQSRWIGFGKLQKLSHIAEVLERYLESGRFAHALDYLLPRVDSPFRFWEGLTERITADPRPLQKRSQPEVYRILLDYAVTLRGIDPKTVKRLLSLDFSAQEHKNPPYFLREE